MSNLRTYLAEKYMSGPKADAILAKTAPQRKKKQKGQVTESSGGGMMIRDDDGGWANAKKEEEDDLVDAVVEKDRGFKTRKVLGSETASNWITVEEGVGGTSNMTQEEISRAQETVYRDSSGKKIDTKAAKAEAARLKRERDEREAKKMEWGKGLVQRDEAEKRRLELEKQKTTTFARYADDKDLNEELKAKELWNDPAARFMTQKKNKGPRKPEYTGPPPPPNRFGIKPGYRWDGVDRSNGFEKKYFQTLNSKKRKGAESYQWRVDDM